MNHLSCHQSGFSGFIRFQYGTLGQKSKPIESEIMETRHENQTVNLKPKAFRIKMMTIPKIKGRRLSESVDIVREVEYLEVTNSLRLVFSLAITLAITSVYFLAV